MEIFDFCTDTRVIEEIAPDERGSIAFNGWEATIKPTEPYRRTFKVTLSGLRWYVDPKQLNVATNPEKNAGRLLDFYQRHRLYKEFRLHHEYLGPIVCKFKSPVNVPKAIRDSGGLIDDVEIMMIHSNPRYE